MSDNQLYATVWLGAFLTLFSVVYISLSYNEKQTLYQSPFYNASQVAIAKEATKRVKAAEVAALIRMGKPEVLVLLREFYKPSDIADEADVAPFLIPQVPDVEKK
jgi:hypothetical protein